MSKSYIKKKQKGDIVFESQKLCPLNSFKKCIGKECAFYSYTGYKNEKGILVSTGECALFKLPFLLIDVKNLLIEKQ